MIRIPKITTPERIRIEIRIPDAGVNPFIAFAAILCAGLEGIRKEIDPNEYKTSTNVYEKSFDESRLLPLSLEESLSFFESEGRIFNSMGAIIDRFVKSKKEEIKDYKRAMGSVDLKEVSTWEIRKYLCL